MASSGWTSAWRTATWEAMIGAARAGAFDVLVVGYVSRFLRNLKQTLIAVEDHLPAAGVVVLFADERLLFERPRRLGPVHPRGPRGRGVQPQAVQAGRRGLRRQAPTAGRPGRQPGALRPHPGGQARPCCGSTRRRPPSSCAPTSSPPPARPTGRSRRPRARQDPRRRDPDEPHLRRTAADRRDRGHRADRRPGALVDGPDDAGATAHADAGTDREAPVRAPPALPRLWSLPLRRRRPLPPSVAHVRGVPGGDAADPAAADRGP